MAKDLVAATRLPVAVPNYRLSSRVAQDIEVEESIKHPMHAQDIALALSSIRRSDNLPTRTNIDRLFLIGHSCGAHMISSLLLVPPSIDNSDLNTFLASDVQKSIQAVALAEGIYDLDLLLDTFPDYRDFVQGAFGPTDSSYSQLSVNKYNTRTTETRWLVIHSSGDTLVDLPQAESMFDHLQAEYARTGADSSKVQKDFTTLTVDHDDMLSTPTFVDIIKRMVLI